MRTKGILVKFIFAAISIIFSDAKSFSWSKLKIIGGQPTKIEQHPYQLSLIYGDAHICGASLIRPSYALTAAHCTHNLPDPAELSVRAGSSIVNEGGIVKRVVAFEEHEKFVKKTFDYDIAILKLESEFALGPLIQLATLVEQDEAVPGGTSANATGWGRLKDHGPVPMQLQVVTIPVLPDEICHIVFGDEVTERMMCAGVNEGGKDTCEGDSGGPLVVNGVQVAITSWGDGCGQPNSPGVYTKLSYFRDYIDETVAKLEEQL